MRPSCKLTWCSSRVEWGPLWSVTVLSTLEPDHPPAVHLWPPPERDKHDEIFLGTWKVITLPNPNKNKNKNSMKKMQQWYLSYMSRIYCRTPRYCIIVLCTRSVICFFIVKHFVIVCLRLSLFLLCFAIVCIDIFITDNSCFEETCNSLFF